jgi:hypothetical protein
MSFLTFTAQRHARPTVWWGARLAAIALTLFAGLAGFVTAQHLPAGCGAIRVEGQFGPFDYRADHFEPGGPFNTHEGLRAIVERAHFTPEVEAGIRGKSSSRAAADISYTLRAFPNHHRALIAMSNISIREGTDKPFDSSYTLGCWFQRAIAWRSDDMIVRLIYASHLTKTKQLKEANAQAVVVAANAGDNPFTHLNVGLVYFDMANYEQALQHAQQAIAMGLNNMTLKDLLVHAGKWSEPLPPTSQNPEQDKP